MDYIPAKLVNQNELALFLEDTKLAADEIIREHGYVIIIEQKWRAFFCLTPTQTGCQLHHFYLKPPADAGLVLSCMELAEAEARRQQRERLAIDNQGGKQLEQLWKLFGFQQAEANKWEKTLT